MGKRKVAICMEDLEFRDRFTSCFIKYYGKEIELHLLEEESSLWKGEVDFYESVILEGKKEELWDKLSKISEKEMQIWKNKVIWLQDLEKIVEKSENVADNPQEKVQIVDKFQNINQIVEYIRRGEQKERRISLKKNQQNAPARLLGVYSLSEVGVQLPFAIVLGEALAEKEKVLLVDLQENSGIREYCQEDWDMGLEELIVMAGETGKAFTGISNCIGHMGRVDFIYPAKNSESLCQVETKHYKKVLEVLVNELGYDVILLNFGSRFQGFSQMIAACWKLYYLTGTKGGCWRKVEFLNELKQKGFETTEGFWQEVELPAICGGSTSCRKLVEKWQWSSFGDEIRSLCQKAVYYG